MLQFFDEGCCVFLSCLPSPSLCFSLHSSSVCQGRQIFGFGA
nr:MAG TPA: protein of unknown function (DUF4672) [Caudoviricetes sp.]